MMQTVVDFFQSVLIIVNNENTTFEQKIEILVENYIEKMKKEPNVPLFILSEIQSRPEDFLQKIPFRQILTETSLYKQFQQEVESGRIAEKNLVNFMTNLMALVLVPVIAQPILKTIGGISNAQYNQLLNERKKQIPVWVKAMFYTS